VERRDTAGVSQENVEVVRGIYAAWQAGTSARGFMDADIEYVNPPDAVETGTVRGASSFGLIRDAYDDVEVRPIRFIDAGEEVVVVGILTCVSRGARVPIEREQGYVWTVQDGKATRFCWFNTPREALEAAGLAE
jgi:ketosteroid isomerase-like protein